MNQHGDTAAPLLKVPSHPAQLMPEERLMARQKQVGDQWEKVDV
jgi:hypothetical protein